MKVVYTKHALKKFKDLAELKIYILRTKVDSIIKKPINIDEVSDFPNKIATGILDKTHVLRIVYKEEHKILSEASKREWEIKRFSRKEKEQLISRKTQRCKSKDPQRCHPRAPVR